MDWIQTVALAILQGLTEFLPISSSAHLILLPIFLDLKDQGLAFDVAVHVGSLCAVIVYFRHDLKHMIQAWLDHVLTGRVTEMSHLAWMVFIASLPIIVIGLLLNGYVDQLRNPLVIATTTLVFALLLWWADRKKSEYREQPQMHWKDACIIGLAQILALIPGTSRSGITMTAALSMGFSRKVAARFSFLLSIPVIIAAGTLKTVDLVKGIDTTPWLILFVGALISGCVAYLCIHWFLRWIDRVGMLPFVIYRIGLALVLYAIYL